MNSSEHSLTLLEIVEVGRDLRGQSNSGEHASRDGGQHLAGRIHDADLLRSFGCLPVGAQLDIGSDLNDVGKGAALTEAEEKRSQQELMVADAQPFAVMRTLGSVCRGSCDSAIRMELN